MSIVISLPLCCCLSGLLTHEPVTFFISLAFFHDKLITSYRIKTASYGDAEGELDGDWDGLVDGLCEGLTDGLADELILAEGLMLGLTLGLTDGEDEGD